MAVLAELNSATSTEVPAERMSSGCRKLRQTQVEVRPSSGGRHPDCAMAASGCGGSVAWARHGSLPWLLRLSWRGQHCVSARSWVHSPLGALSVARWANPGNITSEVHHPTRKDSVLLPGVGAGGWQQTHFRPQRGGDRAAGAAQVSSSSGHEFDPQSPEVWPGCLSLCRHLPESLEPLGPSIC